MQLNDHGQILAKALPLFGAVMARDPVLAELFVKLLTLWATPYGKRSSLIAEITSQPSLFRPAWDVAKTDEERHSISFIARAWDVFDPFGRYLT